METDVATIGVCLRDAREKLGLSSYEVYRETRIPTTILEALEDDDYSNFPSATYAKSYLAQYASFLSVDATDWLNAIGSCRYTFDEFHSAFTNAAEFSKPNPNKATYSKGKKFIPTLIAVSISAVLIYGAYVVVHIYETEEKKRSPSPASAIAPPESAPTHAVTTKIDAEDSISLNDNRPANDSQPTDAGTPPRANIIQE